MHTPTLARGAIGEHDQQHQGRHGREQARACVLGRATTVSLRSRADRRNHRLVGIVCATPSHGRSRWRIEDGTTPQMPCMAHFEVMDDFERREHGLGPANARVVVRTLNLPTSTAVRRRPYPAATRLARQPEHPLADDVALHLAGAATDGERLAEQEAVVPPGVQQPAVGLVGAEPLVSVPGTKSCTPSPPVSIAAAPMRSRASAITCWPCSSARILRMLASGPGLLALRAGPTPCAGGSGRAAVCSM